MSTRKFTLRSEKDAPLTHEEMDTNVQLVIDAIIMDKGRFTFSQTVTGKIKVEEGKEYVTEIIEPPEGNYGEYLFELDPNINWEAKFEWRDPGDGRQFTIISLAPDLLYPDEDWFYTREDTDTVTTKPVPPGTQYVCITNSQRGKLTFTEKIAE